MYELHSPLGVDWYSQLLRMKRSGSRRTGPVSYKRSRMSSAKSIQKASTLAAPRRTRIEVKRSYAEVPVSIVNGSGFVSPLPLIAAGDESDQRDGRAVQIKGWEVRGHASTNTSTGGALVRVIVFKWKRVGAGPSLAQILYDNGSGLAVHRSYNIEEAANYDILQDRMYNLGARCLSIAGTAFDPWEEPIHLYGSTSFVQTYSSPGINDVADVQLLSLIHI